MSEVVNLNRVRKARDRVKKRAQADENAVKFGRTKAEREIDEARAKKARDALRQHRLDEE
ncbi:MAG: DUF4169 family protein [Roseovarius sp.]